MTSPIRPGPPTGKRVSKGDGLIHRARSPEAVAEVARKSQCWVRTWVYVDDTTIIAAEREMPDLEDILVIVLDGSLGIRASQALLLDELDMIN